MSEDDDDYFSLELNILDLILYEKEMLSTSRH